MSSFQTKTKVYHLLDDNKKPTETKITIVNIGQLNLWIVTDLPNFGSDWLQVVYSPQTNLFTTRTLFGSNDDTLGPVCRFFAQTLVDNRKIVVAGGGGGSAGADAVTDLPQDIVLTFNISLKSVDIVGNMDTVRQLAKQLADM